ncbi:hypothetical protein [Actinomyces wuliandei]|uniref:hypothetical protein n=1 Tax=Actinomyces wuliandei TaxID=2057743 RepID=UPI000FD911F3|nr:hypothetical protein [Actinomyces wuliandei]
MSTIDVKVVTQPSNAWDLQADLSSQASNLDTASTDLASTRRNVASEVIGQTGSSAAAALSSQVSTLDTLSSDVTSLSSALDTFAYAMSSVKTRLEAARAQATGAGLTVSGDLIQAPEDSSDPDYEAKMTTFNQIAETVEAVREDETSAHEELQSACRGLSGQAMTAQSLATVAAGGSQVITWGNRGVKMAQWTAISRISTFRPRDASGRFIGKATTKKWGRWKTAWEKTKSKNWLPRPGTKGTTAWKIQNAAGKAAPALKKAGVAGTVLSGAATAWDQYKSDSANNPSMGEGTKIARAAVQGVSEAGTAAAFSAGGAKAGATLGAMLGGPIGIAVGGIVGGALGAAVGSGFGKAAGGWLKDKIGKIF